MFPSCASADALPCSGLLWRSSSTTARRPPTTSATCWGERSTGGATVAGEGVGEEQGRRVLKRAAARYMATALRMRSHSWRRARPFPTHTACLADARTQPSNNTRPPRPHVPSRSHEGEGSAFALLKARGWATGLVAGEAGTSYRRARGVWRQGEYRRPGCRVALLHEWGRAGICPPCST